MAKNLILYGHSGFDMNNYGSFQKIALNCEDPIIILLEDGVIGSVNTLNIENKFVPYSDLLNKNIPLYCVIEDLEARSYESSNLKENIKPISYLDLIDLIETSEQVISIL
ncbi:MAG: DsrH/TusB family sulfur metabolism protein [Promethearchaeota archaeon]